MGLHQIKLKIGISAIVYFFYLSPIFSNTIYVYTQEAAAPYFNFTNQNEPEGFIFDILQTLNEGVNSFEYRNDTLNIKSTEFIYGYITKSSVPVGYKFIELPHRIDYYVFKRKGANIISLNDLLNKKTIVLKNDLPYPVLYENKASHILTIKSYKEALLMLSSGINDCAIVPFQTGMKILENEKIKNIDYVITPFLTFDLGIAIPENWIEINEKFEKQLQKSIKNNTYKNLEEKWFLNDVEVQGAWGKRDKILVYALVVLLIIVLLLIVFIRFLIFEIHASTRDYIGEISESNISPLTIDLSNPLIKKLLESAPAWLFVNDISGKIHHISQDLLLEILHTEEVPDNLMVTDLFNTELSRTLGTFDQRLSNQGSNLITQQIQVEIENEVSKKWLIKYPLKIQGNGQLLFLNLFLNPIIDGDYSFRSLSPEFLFHAVIDALPDLIFIKNDKGYYLGGNKAFFKFSGKTADKIIGKTDLEIFGEEKDAKYSKSDKIVFKAGIIWEGQEWDQMHNGENVRLETVKIPLLNKKNEIFALVGISHDVTKHHKYE
jgi:PAS domain S-box-containing protein